MPNLKWSQISHLQLGKIAEYYAQVEFLSYGYEIYDTIVDDRGIDFIARKNDETFEIQVKAVRNYNYTFISESKMPSLSEKRLVCYMNFTDNTAPVVYVIPATAWINPNEVFTHKKYESGAEYGINLSRKNAHILDDYIATNVLEAIKNSCSIDNEHNWRSVGYGSRKETTTAELKSNKAKERFVSTSEGTIVVRKMSPTELAKITGKG